MQKNLLRNLNVARGLCNGTRMIIDERRQHFIQSSLLSTFFTEEETFIPKCLLSPANIKKDRQHYTRFQFPLRLAYAITVNKSQGQTFERVGIILNNNVFAHGQLYLAMSRCTSGKNVDDEGTEFLNYLMGRSDYEELFESFNQELAMREEMETKLKWINRRRQMARMAKVEWTDLLNKIKSSDLIKQVDL